MATHKRENDLFSQRVKSEREARGWTQRQFAEMLGWHWTTAAKVENGQRSVRVDEAAMIADLFGVSLDVLLGRKANLRTDVAYILRGMQQDASKAAHEIGGLLDDIADWSMELEAARSVQVVPRSDVTPEMIREHDMWQPLGNAVGTVLRDLHSARDALYEIARFEPSPEDAPKKKASSK